MTWASAVAFPVALLVAALGTGRLIRWLLRRGTLDVPNERSSHTRPTPRGGGLTLLLGATVGVAVASAFGAPSPSIPFIVGVGALAVLGYVDDTRGLSVRARFPIQTLAAAFVAWRAGGLDHLPLPPPLDVATGPLAIPIAVVWIVGVANLYNFLDGIDGFAGTQALIAGLACAVVLGPGAPTTLGLAIAGGSLGFLLHNWHPARVFMGDVGSATLGFAFAALAFEGGAHSTDLSTWFVAMALWFFLFDGAWTLYRRLRRGARITEAHREHLYQRLVRSGLAHDQVVRRVMSAATALAILSGSIIFYVRQHPTMDTLRWAVMGLAVIAAGAYDAAVRRAEGGGRDAGHGDAISDRRSA